MLPTVPTWMPRRDGLAHGHRHRVQVGVERALVVAVVDDHELAVAGLLLARHRRGDHAGRGRDDRVAEVVGAVEVDGAHARAVAGPGACRSTTSPHGNGISYAVTGWAVGLMHVSAPCDDSPSYEPSSSVCPGPAAGRLGPSGFLGPWALGPWRRPAALGRQPGPPCRPCAVGASRRRTPRRPGGPVATARRPSRRGSRAAASGGTSGGPRGVGGA